LVLDEATSAIDVAGERQILARLRALAPRPTIIVIAHRAESLALCDRVFRLEAGRCVDDTTPERAQERLMTRNIS
jgi:ATP-binding cassette subfamily C protein